MSADQSRVVLEQYAKERFAFLVEEKGFRLKRGERNVWYTQTYYLAEDIGVSVTVQYLDPEVDVYLIRTQQGKLLPDWNTLATRRRWERAFPLAVENVLHVQDERLERLLRLGRSPQPWEPHVIEAMLSTYSSLVEDHIDALRACPPDVLFPERSAKP